MSIVGNTSPDDIYTELASRRVRRGERAIARTERVVKPDDAVTIHADTGNVRRAILRIGRTVWRRDGIFGHTVVGAVRRLADDQFTNIAIVPFTPPDITGFIIGNQMRSDAVIAGTVYIGQVFKYVVVIDGAIRVGYNAPDAMNVAVVLSKPDGVRGRIGSANAVGPTIGGRRGILGDDMCGGVKFANLIGTRLGKPEMPVLVESCRLHRIPR